MRALQVAVALALAELPVVALPPVVLLEQAQVLLARLARAALRVLEQAPLEPVPMAHLALGAELPERGPGAASEARLALVVSWARVQQGQPVRWALESESLVWPVLQALARLALEPG